MRTSEDASISLIIINVDMLLMFWDVLCISLCPREREPSSCFSVFPKRVFKVFPGSLGSK